MYAENRRGNGMKRKNRKENVMALLVRMWAAGAVCFFAAWGRSGTEEAGQAYSVDLIAGLIVVLLLADWIVVNPIINMAFNIQRNPPPKTPAGIAVYAASHIARNVILVLLIVATYYALNVFFIGVLDLDEKAVPVPLEPILFGILYGLYYAAGSLCIQGVKSGVAVFFKKTEAVPKC
jgi:hypothetical protein